MSRKIIPRQYLSQLVRVLHTQDIKTITGVRRSGKSVLLSQLSDYLTTQNPSHNIIHINYNLVENDSLRDYVALHQYVSERYRPGVQNFVLIDEVQMCREFARALNSFHAEDKYRLVVTGSNAFLDHNSLATLLVGRTFDIEIYPFSFAEYRQYYPEYDLESAFDGYLAAGGFAGTYQIEGSREKMQALASIFQALVVRDIQEKFQIRDLATLRRVTNYALDNIGNLTTSNNIAVALQDGRPDKGNQRKTVANYLEYLTNAFILYKVDRLNLRGRQYLNPPCKYYVVDHSFRRAILGSYKEDYGRIYENIVAMELFRRGWEIAVGVIDGYEVDFVATKRGDICYFQVCADVRDPQTRQREIDNLLRIPDNYPKTVITRSPGVDGVDRGIRIVDLAAWLLEF